MTSCVCATRWALPMTAEVEDRHSSQLDMIKWHIVRSDSQRVGLWTRAAAVLGADTLVLAGATVLLTLSPTTPSRLGKLAALLTMALVLVSAVRAAQVIGTVRDWSRTIEPHSPSPVLYNLPETVKFAGSYPAFRELVAAQSMSEQVESATSELWRLSCLHRRRIHALRSAGHWLLIAVIALMLSRGDLCCTQLRAAVLADSQLCCCDRTS